MAERRKALIELDETLLNVEQAIRRVDRGIDELDGAEGSAPEVQALQQARTHLVKAREALVAGTMATAQQRLL